MPIKRIFTLPYLTLPLSFSPSLRLSFSLGLSDHSIVYAVRKFSIPSKNTHKHVTTRSFKTFNANAFREDLKAAPFESLKNCSTRDEMVEVRASMFSKIADAHAPIRTRREKASDNSKTAIYLG